jgi:hypothetical protein
VDNGNGTDAGGNLDGSFDGVLRPTFVWMRDSAPRRTTATIWVSKTFISFQIVAQNHRSSGICEAVLTEFGDFF